MKKFTRNYPLSILLLGLCIIFFPVLFSSKTYFLRDITNIFHPWKNACLESLINGVLPLWNDYVYCGMPLLANWQSAVFYPFSIVFYIFGFPLGLKVYFMIHIFIAGLFAYLYARSKRFTKWAALGMCVFFAFNGYLLTKLEFLSHIGVDVWIFAILLFASNPLLLSLTLAVSFLSGHQIFVFQLIILITYAVFLQDSKTYRSVFIAGILSIMLTAVQLLPTIELISASKRFSEGITASIAMIHSLKYHDLLNFISPVFDNKVTAAVIGEKYQWDTCFYTGIIALLVICARFYYLKFGKLLTWALFLIIAGIILSLGDTTPLYPFLYRNVIIFKMLRYSVQLSYFILVGVSVLLAFSLNKMNYGWLIVFLICFELLIYGYNFHPVCESGYFYDKPESVKFLQNNMNDNDRFILSPGTEKDRLIKADSVEDAWKISKSYLYGLTCMPYHLKNAYGFGEPLTTDLIENKVNTAYSLPTPDDAFKNYKQLKVKYMLCKKELPKTNNYSLAYNTDIFIYKLNQNPFNESIDMSAYVTKWFKTGFLITFFAVLGFIIFTCKKLI